MLEFLGSLAAIVLVDLALSGDNALVIGAAAATLERSQRTLAILTGGGAAIVLRILFAIAATLLLKIPLLEAIGGAVLLLIAARLLMTRGAHGSPEEGASPAPRGTVSLGSAMLTILIADVTMSLDNILALGGLARGNLPLLVVGLLISVALLLVGGAIVAALIGRLPWLLDLAALILGWTAGQMVYQDQIAGHFLSAAPFAQYVIPILGVLITLGVDVYLRWRARRRASLAVGGVSKTPDPDPLASK